jgi:electron transfer DM13
MDWLGDIGAAFFGAIYDYRFAVAGAGVLIAIVTGWIAWRRNWLSLARRHPRRAAAIGVPVLAVALPLAWYLASPLVLSATVDEPAPVAIASRAPSPPVAPSSEAPVASRAPSGSRAPAPSDPAPPPLALSGAFHGSDEFHFGRGTARLIETAPGEFVVRLEDFAVRNGPDLYVYLSPDPAGYAKSAIELGRLKADKGNQNYVVPAGALDDPASAASVVIWCKQFSHLFATAPLAAA